MASGTVDRRVSDTVAEFDSIIKTQMDDNEKETI
jgi:hypothetical protein